MDATKLPPLNKHQMIHHKSPIHDFFIIVAYVLLMTATGVAVGVNVPKLFEMEPVNVVLSALAGAVLGIVLGIGKVKSQHRIYRD